ncbi:pickpocket protein 28-like [Bacillus rossius redtenbacheri]|uniref:pickpocket protein 28-like n=1 Tax=Bacillus rossius redtenbacheri TaxID=93214 RepID=UPI002FDDC4D0
MASKYRSSAEVQVSGLPVMFVMSGVYEMSGMSGVTAVSAGAAQAAAMSSSPRSAGAAGRRADAKQVMFAAPARESDSLRGRAREYFQDYASNAAVDGIKYIGEEDRHLVEKLFWALVMLLSLGLCSQQIYNMWLKWTYAPVIVSFDERSTPVWEIPFPAVTICSETKARQTIFNFTWALFNYDQNMTEDDLKTLTDVALMCDEQYGQGENFTTEEVIDLFRNVSPSMDQVLKEVRWRNKPELVSDIFTPIVTEEGICFTFNMLDPTEIFTNIAAQYNQKFTQHGKKSSGWTLDKGYDALTPLQTYPNRALGAGYNVGLVVMLRSFTEDIDYLCKGAVPGFRVLLHNPAELPRVSQQYLRSDLNQELVVSVRPHMMVTNQGLQLYSPYVRQCFFPFERELRYFRVYTQNNCQQECLANFTLLYCGCVGFYMPRESYAYVHVPVYEMRKRDVEQGLGDAGLDDSVDCDCLPSCTEMQYNGETSTAVFSWRNMVVAQNMDPADPEWDGANIGRVVVFFKDSQFITSKRSEIFGTTDFWANCGGLLGLFLGISVLSIVEMGYYLTLRVWLEPGSKQRFCLLRLLAATISCQKSLALDVSPWYCMSVQAARQSHASPLFWVYTLKYLSSRSKGKKHCLT